MICEDSYLPAIGSAVCLSTWAIQLPHHSSDNVGDPDLCMLCCEISMKASPRDHEITMKRDEPLLCVWRQRTAPYKNSYEGDEMVHRCYEIFRKGPQPFSAVNDRSCFMESCVGGGRM